MRSLLLLLPLAASAAAPEFRVERKPIAGGAELLTVFGQRVDTRDGKTTVGDVPLLAVLRDTLGDDDPANDRLRYVWILTSAQPTLLQRAAASLPFFYWRPTFDKNPDSAPPPVIDLSATGRGVWPALAGSLTQAMALDPSGALVRSSTRSYRNNLADHRRLHLLEGLAVLSQLQDDPEVKALLSEPELLEIQTRLTLAGKAFGGLVDSAKLPEAYFKERAKTEQMRGHNWELLRQRAEANGLYFEPLGLNGSATHALLWVAKEDLASAHKFSGQLLAISDPFTDARLKNWTGYTVVREVDADPPRQVELIPLALYSLEYPKVPLRLVDFRDMRAPKRHEMMRHAATDTVSGVLGISKLGNWPFMAGSWTWSFIRTRHGDANNRNARLKGFSQVRQLLALDTEMDPGLRAELQKRLEVLGVNPLEDSVFREAKLAQQQYEALLRYADDPHGLPERLQHDRQNELVAYDHGWKGRAGLKLAHIATLGLYNFREVDPDVLQTRLDRERRELRNAQFLESVDVAWNLDEVKRALDQLASSGIHQRSVQAVERIYRETKDEQTRALCQKALQSLDVAGQ